MIESAYFLFFLAQGLTFHTQLSLGMIVTTQQQNQERSAEYYLPQLLKANGSVWLVWKGQFRGRFQWRRTIMIEMRHAGNKGRPASDQQQRYDHLWHYTPLNPHNDWPFGMLGHVPWSVLMIHSLHLAKHGRNTLSGAS